MLFNLKFLRIKLELVAGGNGDLTKICRLAFLVLFICCCLFVCVFVGCSKLLSVVGDDRFYVLLAPSCPN